MNIAAAALVIFAYIIGPIYIGWVVSTPKTEQPDPLFNAFFCAVFIMFFILGSVLRYHLGAK